MIEEVIKLWDERKNNLRNTFLKFLNGDLSNYDYAALLKIVLDTLYDEDRFNIDSERIVCCRNGAYSGDLMLVFPSMEYTETIFYYTFVSYGSCSGCDELERVLNCDNKKEKIADLMTLSLHLVQSMKSVCPMENLL